MVELILVDLIYLLVIVQIHNFQFILFKSLQIHSVTFCPLVVKQNCMHFEEEHRISCALALHDCGY